MGAPFLLLARLRWLAGPHPAALLGCSSFMQQRSGLPCCRPAGHMAIPGREHGCMMHFQSIHPPRLASSDAMHVACMLQQETACKAQVGTQCSSPIRKHSRVGAWSLRGHLSPTGAGYNSTQQSYVPAAEQGQDPSLRVRPRRKPGGSTNSSAARPPAVHGALCRTMQRAAPGVLSDHLRHLRRQIV